MKSKKQRPKLSVRDRVSIRSGKWAGRSGTVLAREGEAGAFTYDVRVDDLPDLLSFAEDELEYIRSGGY